MKLVEGGVTAPRGYKAAGAAAGVKTSSTKKDCALIVSDVPATAAGVFTTNRVKAAPVLWCQRVCSRGTARAVFINSGNANACTGARGERDAAATAAHVAKMIGASPDEILVCSTGVIGAPLPMERITIGVELCAAALSESGSHDAALAIMTTDRVPKESACEISLNGGPVRLGAIAKGAGMISPHMATMICVLTTDAAVEAAPLADALRRAVDRSFNCVCVDNDMSTNDTVLCLANGRAGAAALQPGSADFAAFERALTALCTGLAKALVKDGEGATKLVEIVVSGAGSDKDAAKAARAIAQSQLCKTAFFGQDPNWGRLACAVGYSGADFDPNCLSIRLDDVEVMTEGRAGVYDETDAAAVMKQASFRVSVKMGGGPGSARFWTSDLSDEYVRINADYRS